jgi:PKHD-type hydroxylase
LLYKIPKVLNKEQLKNVQDSLDAAEFVDGKLTAGKVAKKVKNNLELNKELKHIDLLNNAVMAAIMDNQTFQHAALPTRISTPIFSKYTKGMSYGKHVDDPIMGQVNGQYRSDVSLTLFLSEPDDYTGGELTVETAFGSQQVKLAAGDMVVYPSSSIHQVMPIIDGTRLVMITWMQSMVQDSAKRAILFDLWQAREDLLSKDLTGTVAEKLDISYVNLLRMWAKP